MPKTRRVKAELVEVKRDGPKPIQADPKEIYELAREGMTQCEIAYALGMSPDTWFRRIREQVEHSNVSEISEAYQKGKGDHARLIMTGLTRLAGDGNLGALIFLAKAHLGRRENVQISLPEGDVDANPVKFARISLTPEQRRERIAELEQKRLELAAEK